MLDSHQKPHLFRAMEANQCVLFVGAGFSRGASNQLGKPIPGGEELAQDLWRWLGYAEPYDQTPLPIVFQAALSAGKPLDDLRTLLETNLLASQVASWYETIPLVFWHRIYGTNVDDIIEQTYRKAAEPGVALEVLSAPTDDFRERDQFVRRIQYVKLHGSLPGDPRGLTFATLQYAGRANSQDDWWRHFVRDYVFHPTLFVGSKIDEPLFWQALSARGDRGPNPEERPKSYLVTPSVSPAQRAVLDSFSIAHVPATAEDFFAWLKKEFSFPNRAAVLSLVAPESVEVLERSGANVRLRTSLIEFLSVFNRVPLPDPNPSRPKYFFRGAPPTWEDIAAGYDAPREITGEVLRAAEDGLAAAPKQFSVIAVLAEGGAGKGTILKRAAFALRRAGHEVFFSDGASRIDPSLAADALVAFPRRVCMVIDNASLMGPTLNDLLSRLSKLDNPPVIIFGARFIPFEQRLRASLDGHQFVELDIPCLSDPDIEQLIATLERHNQLGHLAPMSHDERLYELKQRAKKQILVAMREATEGADFNKIIASEYREIDSHEARVLFLCAALGTDALVDLTEQQWFDCAEVLPAEALRIMRRDLRGMVELVGSREHLVAARHPIIAEYLLDNVAGRGDVMEAYRRVLLVLARDIYPGAGRRSRSWRLFVRLINHQSIFDRFGEDIERARGVFELTADAFANEGHFWLQYANLEVDEGLPAYARSHLANAEGLLGETDLVLNTRAHMMLREALTVSNYQEALELRREAEDILFSQMDRAPSDDEYPFHVYLTHVLGWIRAWAPDDASKKEQLESLLRTARKASNQMPKNRKLKGVLETIEKEYLMLAVPDDP